MESPHSLLAFGLPNDNRGGSIFLYLSLNRVPRQDLAARRTRGESNVGLLSTSEDMKSEVSATLWNGNGHHTLFFFMYCMCLICDEQHLAVRLLFTDVGCWVAWWLSVRVW